METKLSKWKVFVTVLIGVCCFVLSSARANAAVGAETTNNNFTMIDPGGNTFGGTNDVHFTWDGTKKTSVAVSGQVSNATISSPCAFFGVTWAAHDVAIYGPGTYTVYDGCAPGNPGCGSGNPVTFTVGAGQLGVHMLFYWNGNDNIDVVNVWQPGVFAPSALWTGACGSNPATKVWDLMSTDWNKDGVNGAGMTDGPFFGSNASFNMMGVSLNKVVDTLNNNFTMIDGGGNTFGGANDVHFTWDGTRKTSVAASGQVSNATISSICLFFGQSWAAHDLAIYGPGTYTVYDGCAAGSPGCGSGNPVTFTVGAGQLGGHMLFSWNGNDNLDVVNVWQPGVFAPSGLWTGACGSNPATKAWDMMSTDWDVDGINGAPMTDGPFVGTNPNFNFMQKGTDLCANVVCPTVMVCNSPLACDPATGQCVPTNPSCDDANACTNDNCNLTTGQCVHTAINCNDNNACTADTCTPVTGCIHTPISCNDGNICTNDLCSPLTGCSYMPINCDDGNLCTLDSCSPTTGCIHTPINNCTVVVDTTNNNFTMIDPAGNTFGGANDVHFTWDGTRKTSVAASGQVSNATVSSACPFFGQTWAAHDVAIYGPGTYTIYDGCAAGSPGCGSGNPVTFTVGAGQLGGHLLFYWNGNDNLDVVNVWQRGVFAPSGLWTGACGSNPANNVWDMMSTDWDMDGINGAPMTDGPFMGTDANFNIVGIVGDCTTNANCNDNNACTMDTCVNNACVHTPIYCCDACEPPNTCNPLYGCPLTIVCWPSCNDNNACTIDTCTTATGCVFTPVNCNDNNACTADSCDSVKGCVHTPIVCNDNNSCTTDSCNAAGCVYSPLPDQTACTVNNQPGACAAGACIVAPVCNGVKSAKIRGGGQKPNSVDLQIQTSFTVANDGCIVDVSTSSVTCTPGTVLLVDVKAGRGPMPTSCTWKGAPISTDSQLTVECPLVSGDIGKLICDNKLSGGKDVDRMTITVQ